jgi:hypothetical protein
MLRLVLLLLYLSASSSISSEKQGSGLAPLEVRSPPPTTDAGGGYDPNGGASPSSDAGAGYDPNG